MMPAVIMYAYLSNGGCCGVEGNEGGADTMKNKSTSTTDIESGRLKSPPLRPPPPARRKRTRTRSTSAAIPEHPNESTPLLKRSPSLPSGRKMKRTKSAPIMSF